jgi:hypothetical protein
MLLNSLTLTIASWAFLLEPHWNPTVEEQALARIHRMGQKRPVTTVRLYVRDTFEEVRLMFKFIWFLYADSPVEGDASPRLEESIGRPGAGGS